MFLFVSWEGLCSLTGYAIQDDTVNCVQMIKASLTSLNLIRHSSLWPLPLMKLRSNVSAIWPMVFLLCRDIFLCSGFFHLSILYIRGHFLSNSNIPQKISNVSSSKFYVSPKSLIYFEDQPVGLINSIGTILLLRIKV